MLDYMKAASLAIIDRLDSWQNAITGIGTSRDRAAHTAFYSGCRLSDDMLTALWTSSDLAGKIVDVYPREEMREGFDLENLEDREDEVVRYLGRFHVPATIVEARIWARLYGGAVILVAAADGKDLSEPLEAYAHIDFLKVVDRRFVVPDGGSIPDAKGMPSMYSVTPMGSLGSGSRRVHASRLVFFGGARTEAMTKRQLNGWDLSVLQKPYEALRSSGSVWGGVESLVSEASQTVYKIKNFWSMMAGNQKDKVLARLNAMDQTRSIARAIILDSDGEAFERQNVTFTGLADIEDRALKRVAAAAEIPVTILLGEAPAGLNATGDSDLRWFLNRVKGERQLACEPPLMRLLKLLLAAGDSPISQQAITPDWEPVITWPELWSPSATEAATIRSQQATADATYIDKGVLSPDEVALSRFAPKGWSAQTTIDREAHQAALEADRALLEAGDETAEGSGVQLAPTDIAKILKVNEARKALGLPDIENGELTIEAYNALQVAANEAAADQGAGEAPEGDPAKAKPEPVAQPFTQKPAQSPEQDESEDNE